MTTVQCAEYCLARCSIYMAWQLLGCRRKFIYCSIGRPIDTWPVTATRITDDAALHRQKLQFWVKTVRGNNQSLGLL
jgi:hypothetical protein